MKSKTILITGATSGFGRLAVPLLLNKGHRVIAGIRGGEKRLKNIFQEELTRFPEGRLVAIDLHLDSPDSIRSVPAALTEVSGGSLDVLINNAGSVLLGAFETQTPEQVRRQFEVNFFGPAELTRVLIPALRTARGRILNVSSVGGLVSVPYYGTYNATKHALEAHTEGLRYELSPFGIQVGLIEPGSFQTEILTSGSMGEGAADPQSPYYEATRVFEKFQKDHFSLAGQPIRVARLISRLVDVRRVPVRSLIGPDARIMLWSKLLLPEAWRVGMTTALFNKLIFSKRIAATPRLGG